MVNQKKNILADVLLGYDVENSLKQNEPIIFDIIPLLRYEKGFDQKSNWHCYDVWEHTIKAISHSNIDFEMRLVLLLHDIGKPFCYQDDGDIRHFKNHSLMSAQLSKNILNELGYKDDKLNELLFLIKEHSSKIILENISKEDLYLYRKLLDVQLCDASAYEMFHAQKATKELVKTKNMLYQVVDKF